ncbi:DUF3560 domain-containing protein [Pseudomonadota bacterium]
MTHSNTITPTITNPSEATSVSPLEQSGSPKMKGFKSGKIRKNATKQIASLLAMATRITMETHSMGLDDCSRSNGEFEIDVVRVNEWMAKDSNYSDMRVRLECDENGQPELLRIEGPYYFCDTIRVSFAPVEELTALRRGEYQPEPQPKKREPVQLSTLDDFDLTRAEEVVIKSVEVVWSESNEFSGGEVLTLEQYNEKASRAALEIGRGEGYDKTKVMMNFENGERHELRHDINADFPTLTIDLAAKGYKAIAAVEAVEAVDVVETKTVIRAYSAEYYAWLDTGKNPEPTPADTRNVVSLGDYQGRLEAKKDRLEARAEKAVQQSNHYYQASKDRASMIPFGQPILVGHHSEKRARKDADRIFNDMGKSVAAAEKAQRLEDRAAQVGKNGIASDDPEAVQKLKTKLANLEQSQETMKAVNKVIRSKHMTDADKIEYMVNTHHFTESHAQETLKPDFAGRIGFASYALQNNNATIRTTRERIKELESLHNQKPLEASGGVEGLVWSLYEEDGRVKFKFDGKPSEEVRTLIKANGFKWSRYSTAWVRKITPNAIAAAEMLAKKLTEK